MRGGGLSTQRPAPNQPTNGGVPPPSTIAAQIVNNAANADSRHDTPESNVLFAHLLREFLKEPDGDESDSQLELNAQVVSVVTEGGLTGLLVGNPFAQEALIPQANDSLAVITVIIERKPQLLLSPPSNHGDLSSRTPLFIWLFPTLLGLLGHLNLEPVRPRLRELLVTCLHAMDRDPDSWQQGASLAELYKSCVDSTLMALMMINPLSHISGHSFHVTLPPSFSIGSLWPESQHSVAAPEGTQRTITSEPEAILTALQLINSLLTAELTRNHTSSINSETLSAWAMDSYGKLWQCFKQWNLARTQDHPNDGIQMAFIQVLDLVRVLTISPVVGGAPSLRTASFLSQYISEMVLDCFSTPYNEHNQRLLAYMLVRTHLLWVQWPSDSYMRNRNGKSFLAIISEIFEPIILKVCRDAAGFEALSGELRVALTFLTWPDEGWIEEVNSLRESICSDERQAFIDEDLEKNIAPLVSFFKETNIQEGENLTQPREGKYESNTVDHQEVYRHLSCLLTGSASDSPFSGLAGLHSSIVPYYQSLGENERCALLKALGRMACAGSRSLQLDHANRYAWIDLPCQLCDAPQTQECGTRPFWNESSNEEDWKDILAACLEITQVEEFQDSAKPRVLMALAIGRIFNHLSDAGYVGLANCSLAEWCLSANSRGSRELRIAAGRTLATFLRNDLPDKVKRRNRIEGLGFLQSLAKIEKRGVQETVIMAFGEAARACGDDELPIILLQLVGYLGHQSAFVAGVAFNELQSIAEALDTSPRELFLPFWRTIAPAVVNDLETLPQKAQQLSDLLEMSVDRFLLTTQAEILPHLVLNKKQAVLQRIASARGTTVGDICLQPRKNLGVILAFILIQPVKNIDTAMMDLLIAADPAFMTTTPPKLIIIEPVMVACELLKLAADEPETNRSHILRGLQNLAILWDPKRDSRKTPVKSAASRQKLLIAFLDSHVLGIMALFSDILDNTLQRHPTLERRRCLGAVEVLIDMAKGSVNIALPQVRTCLQSAIQDDRICDQTFHIWSRLVDIVDEEEMGYFAEHTFALIVENWPRFSDSTHRKAYELIDHMIKGKNSILRDRVETLPLLSGIPVMSKFDAELVRLKEKSSPLSLLRAFSRRCGDENAVVVLRALKELSSFLEIHQNVIHDAAVSQKPSPGLSALTRSLLDASIRFSENHPEITELCAQCLGVIGCLDPYRVEAVREKREILVLSNFDKAAEVIDFSTFLLERILFKVFRSTTNARGQGFLAFAIQEVLKFCGFNTIKFHAARSSQPQLVYGKWQEIPESVRNGLVPFLNSKFMIRKNPTAPVPPPQQYPIFTENISHSEWLRAFVYDLLIRGKGENVQILFPVLASIIKGHDLSIASFLLPFAALNVVITGEEREQTDIGQELLIVLQANLRQGENASEATIKQCSENVFQTLDYFAFWLQEKRKTMTELRAQAGRTGRGISEAEEIKDIAQISVVERILHNIPAEVISKRAVECGSYARALFHWEQYMRQEEQKSKELGTELPHSNELLERLQFIYAHIDEPDSVEGISAHLHILNPEQQIMEHRKAGRWTAAQSWYELSLAQKPDDPETQIELLTCLKESGQSESLLNYVEGFRSASNCPPTALPFAAEAAWSLGKWNQLERILSLLPEHGNNISTEFNIGLGRAFLALRQKNGEEFNRIVSELRKGVAKSMSAASTTSIHASHDTLIKLHALYEIKAISGLSKTSWSNREAAVDFLDRRLDVLGAHTSDKQYLLGIRRAAMELSSLDFTKLDIASAWLTSGRLARKANFTTAAYMSVLQAATLGDDASKIEYSKLLWKEGHHRKAIRTLEGAISSGTWQSRPPLQEEVSVAITVDMPLQPNKIQAHAELLYAKWLDRAGQTQSEALQKQYARGMAAYPKWDKPHYYLGHHYNKLLDAEKKLSEKSFPADRQPTRYLTGELAYWVVAHYIRSIVYGTKYYYQTIPKALTLWLDLGMTVQHPPRTDARDHIAARSKWLDKINAHIKKYATERIPAFPWYTAFPQIITRVAHPHKAVWSVLATLIMKVIMRFPQQALWSLLAVLKSADTPRANRGQAILAKLKETQHSVKGANIPDLKTLINHGQKLTDALLYACDVTVEARTSSVSLSRTLGFNLKLAPSSLVVPIEINMLPSVPENLDYVAIRKYNPFTHDPVTIETFLDDVLVLNSLQRPRKLTVVGSDGRRYGLLCKPKDDLRKDQRLMEFNGVINRALRRDVECSKRRLYIPTYSVTPLNEECGTIEWVEGLKPIRDILLGLYRQKGISVDYNQIRARLLDACSDKENHIFNDEIVAQFPAVLHEWFTEQFPDPERWFNARLRYTRSCAVMSIVGHVLGLGDRHGENILLEQGNGGTFHVDFNCLFDKGLTFEKPEMVPFRLTHNMVDAMGPQGVEGPFRTAAELTYRLLQQQEDTLITVLETFVHDPTADFIGKKRRKIPGVPETPQEVLESVRGKLAGMMRGESVPLSVEGYVQSLIQMARDERNLASMYIGWCAFF